MARVKIVVNGRFIVHAVTGMPRYAWELVRRMGDRVQVITPPAKLRGLPGHLWEQAVLPNYSHGSLLWSPGGTGPLAVSRQVVTIHDMAPREHPEWFTPTYAAWYNWLVPRLAKKVLHIITVSHFSRQRLIDMVGIPPEKVTVIYNGVSSNFRPQSASAIARVRRALGIPTPYYVLCLGSRDPRKNLRAAIEAWRLLAHALSDEIWLVIAGGEDSSAVFRYSPLSEVPPRVYITGYVKDELLPALYGGALVFLFPSLYEGFGLPPLEAMACGTPVVAANRASLPEIIGDAGILIDPHDAGGIASAIHSVIEDARLRQHLCERGLARAKLFSWDQAAKETWDLLRTIAQQD